MKTFSYWSKMKKSCLLLIAFAISVALLPKLAIADIYFVHNDQLGANKLTDAQQNIVWQGKRQPFGETEVVAGQEEFNQRFPGQYFDEESGLHYNYFRDYDPSIGRYIQSDPIGLRGGLNTYGYAGGDPLSNIDPRGLNFATAGTGAAWGGAVGGPVGAVAGGIVGFGLGAWGANAAWDAFGDDDYADPYGGYDPYDEHDAEDMANDPSGYESCAEIQEAIVALQNRIRGREQNNEDHCGGDDGHRKRIENLKKALAKLQKMLASCRG